MKQINPEIIKAKYFYEDGDLFLKSGRRVGGSSGGYLVTTVQGVRLPVHRIIWVLHNGVDPGQDDIDHIDRDKFNNNISNLRRVSRQVNGYNREAKGYFVDRDGKCQARIMIDGKYHSLGRFNTPEEAHNKYTTTKEELCRR